MSGRSTELERHFGIPIRSNPQILSGQPIIDGHRITVKAIADKHNRGQTIAEIANAYTIDELKVEAALAYYAAHRLGIDRAIEEDRLFWQHLQDNATPEMKVLRERQARFEARSQE